MIRDPGSGPVVARVPQELPDRRSARRRAVVMTMGALHRGHAELMSAARLAVGVDGEVVVTIFVNPLQFGSASDLQTYPSTWDADLALCEAHGVDVVFAPAASTMYPPGVPEVLVDPGPLGQIAEGKVRPGHFRGVLTVVLKLMNMVRPDFAVFGEKDYQQLVLVQAMVRALNLPLAVIPAAIVRDRDGLALSSRNVRLSPQARVAALALPRAVMRAQRAAVAGAPPERVCEISAQALAEVGITADYVSLYGPEFAPDPASGPARLLVAAYVGGVHLLDNGPVNLGGEQ